MGVLDPRNSMQVCVRHCPMMDMTQKEHVKQFAKQNNSRLCRYDIEPDAYDDAKTKWSAKGPCPDLHRLYKRQVFFISAC